MENSSPEIQMIVLLASSSSSPEIFFGFDWVLSLSRCLSLSFLVACPRVRIHKRLIAFQAPISAADLLLRGAGIDFFS
jgi:hypothetical protein